MKRDKPVFTKEEIIELMKRLKEEHKAERRDFETIEEKKQRHAKEDIYEEERF